MVVSRIRTLAVVTALTLVATAASAAGLQARLGHEVVREGEHVELLLRAPGGAAVAAPDLSPLEKDFEILGTQQSQRLSIVNGRREASVDWTIRLLPRHTGEVVIPAIRAGAASSEPLRLRVADAGPPPSRVDAPDLFVESTVDQMSPYVQGEVRYTVKVYDGIGIRGGGLTEPHAENARVRSVGEGRTYEETVNGRRYYVHEREYAITPQTSGTMAIAPVTLEARIDDPNARGRSPFGDLFGGGYPFADMFGRSGFGSSLFDQMMNPGRQVRVRSNAIQIEVQARPDGADGGWFLPAKHVELGESFEPASPSFRVGEAVKRTIVLRALGASAEQLPAFEIPGAPGIRQYDDGSRDGSVPTEEGTVSVREQTVALVPSQAGSTVLPAIEVKWWDAENQVERTASLPERTIEVLPAVGAEPVAPVPAPVAAPKAPAVNRHEAPSTVEATAAPGTELPEIWIALGLVALLGLGAGGGYAYASRPRAAKAPARGGALSRRGLLAEVEQACKANDPATTREALLRWARETYGVGAPSSPRMIAKKLGNDGFETEAAKLDRSLYAPDAEPFEGGTFWRALRAATRAGGPGEPEAPVAVLPELYPT